MVFSLAQDFKGVGVLLEDIIQEGNLALVEVVDKYNENLPKKAVKRIRAQMKHYINIEWKEYTTTKYRLCQSGNLINHPR